MRKVLTTALAAVTAAGAVLATAAPAQADRYRHHRHKDNDDAVAAAVLGGVAGLALGAALSSKGDRSRSYYYNGYSYDPRYERYRGGYYRDSYYRGRPHAYYDRPYRTCVTRDRVWDPYIGRRVTIERRYAC
ncbi:MULTISPECIES: hypothetical protein [unclassified Phenylobacterium]|uniref:hypothetical protein n=1 Tax=unclassified Phenylobacterium TaxID=2640670 RepID=UPI00083A3AF5|nr:MULTISPECIES: hypothetical protein [unclassified Phenylobacterium]